MTAFDAALRRIGELDEDTLGRPWTWRDTPIDVRYALYRTLEEAQGVHQRISAQPHSESRRILALAQRAFGDLRGLLIGLPTELLDRAPRDGEWPLRETLRHVLTVERRYAVQTRYAVERADAEPVRIPEDRQPTVPAHAAEGDIEAILARIGEARAETNRWLGDVAPAAMTRPTIWVGAHVDVRFRLHRFAPHLVEHTIQCEKTLHALGWHPTEGRRIARHIAAAIAEIEGLGAQAQAGQLETLLAGRLASIKG